MGIKWKRIRHDLEVGTLDDLVVGMISHYETPDRLLGDFIYSVQDGQGMQLCLVTDIDKGKSIIEKLGTTSS